MARGFLGLVFSADSIIYAYLERKAGVILCSKAGSVPFDEGVLSSSSVSESVHKIISEEKISPLKAFVTVFTPETITHQINLPKMPRQELDEVIAGEIEKAPVFADKEFDYIYRGYATGLNRLEITFSAIRRDILDSIVKGVEAVKLSLESLEIAPLNLLNILPNLPATAKEEALLVLGQRQSYIIVSDKKECRFFYMMSTGKIDLYPYSDGKINNSALLHWVDELDRILKSYAIENKKETIKKVWFIWDNTKASDLAELLDSEMRDHEISELSIGDITGFRKEYDEEFNPIYFLGCCGPIAHIKKINSMFAFSHFLSKSKLKSYLKKAVFASVLYIALISIFAVKTFIIYSAKEKRLTQQLGEINAQNNKLRQETARLKKERDEFLDMRSRLLEQATFVRNLNRISWSRVFGEVAAELPDELSLASFKVPESGKVEIKGSAFKIESVAKLMRKIYKSSVLQNAKFDFLREIKIEDRNIFSFGIVADLKRNSDEKK